MLLAHLPGVLGEEEPMTHTIAPSAVLGSLIELEARRLALSGAGAVSIEAAASLPDPSAGDAGPAPDAQPGVPATRPADAATSRSVPLRLARR
jgi:hypothetical protein